MTGGFLVWRWHWRCGEFGIVNGDILLHLVDLDSEAVAGTGERPAVRDFYAVGVAVVGVVDLRGHAAEGSFGVTDKAKQQAGLLIEVEAQGRLALVAADDEVGVVAVDFLAGNYRK